MNEWLVDFHFLRPLWLLALLPLAGLLWLLHRSGATDSAWQNICDEHLLPYMLVTHGTRRRSWILTLLTCAWLIAVLALAGPTWSRQPQSVFQILDTHIIVLDLSRSMDAPDLKPSRALRARFKVADILAQNEDGQVGLVVFAGAAFVVSPVTRDSNTVTNMLPALLPEIMPVAGSRVDLGLRKAAELLTQAGVRRGSVLLITDAGNGEPALEAARSLYEQGFPVSVLGVGTEQGMPIPTAQGELLKDSDGNIVIPRLNHAELQRLAQAGGGRYAAIRADNQDLQQLLNTHAGDALTADTEKADQQAENWQEQGPWLALLLLPLAALAFRRGWLLALVLLVSTPVSIPPAAAWNWDDLWWRRDQQFQRALDDDLPQRAMELADEAWQRGTAAYRAGDYQQALDAFSQLAGASGHYNRGNALTRLGHYEQALQAYDAALHERPDMSEAQFNRDIAEKLLQQQQEQQQQEQGEQQQQSESRQNQGGDNENSGDTSSDQSQSSDEGQQSDRQSGAGDDDQQSNETDEQSGSQRQESDLGEPGKDNNDDPQATQQDAQQNRPEPGEEPSVAQGEADYLSEEQRQVMEQWLRRIPDDPAGLLRNKFLRQYQRRAAQPQTDGQTW